MQYILTNEELTRLEQKGMDLEGKHRAMVQDLCSRVACCERVKYKYGDEEREEVWGCIRIEGSGHYGHVDYCTHCPVQEQCPCPHKEYGK